MTYEELVAKLKSNFEGMDAGKIKEHVAIQFNVAGEAEGALYMEISDGRIMIEPYEYYDRDILVFVETDALLAIAEGECTIYDAFKEGKFYAEGNLGKAELLDAISKKVAAKKEAEKKKAEEQKVEEEKQPEVVIEETVSEAATEVMAEEKQPEAALEEPVPETVAEVVPEEKPVKESEAIAPAKKSTGKKVSARKLKKAAAKKNAKKNSAKK